MLVTQTGRDVRFSIENTVRTPCGPSTPPNFTVTAPSACLCQTNAVIPSNPQTRTPHLNRFICFLLERTNALQCFAKLELAQGQGDAGSVSVLHFRPHAPNLRSFPIVLRKAPVCCSGADMDAVLVGLFANLNRLDTDDSVGSRR